MKIPGQGLAQGLLVTMRTMTASAVGRTTPHASTAQPHAVPAMNAMAAVAHVKVNPSTKRTTNRATIAPISGLKS